MALSKQRMAEIGFALFMARAKQEGMLIKGDMNRQINARAKEVGIPSEELKQFFEALIPQMLGSALGYEEVSITYGEPRKS